MTGHGRGTVSMKSLDTYVMLLSRYVCSRVCDVSVEALKSLDVESLSLHRFYVASHSHKASRPRAMFVHLIIFIDLIPLYFFPLYRQTHKYFVCVVLCVCVLLRVCGPRVLECMRRTKIEFPLGLSVGLVLGLAPLGLAPRAGVVGVAILG